MISGPANRINRDIARQSTLSRDIARTQIEIATGRKIQARSDAPTPSARLDSLRRQSADTVAWQQNIDAGLSRNAQADTALRGVSDQLKRAYELIVAGANGTLNQADRASIAGELETIAADIDARLAATGADGRNLFSSGPAIESRFGPQTIFAAVPSRDAIAAAGDFSQTLRDAASSLRTGNTAATALSVDAVARAVGSSADFAADIGARGARLSALREQLTDAEIDRAAERSSIEDVDLSEAIARLNQQTLTLDAARAAFARINRETLFDILR